MKIRAVRVWPAANALVTLCIILPLTTPRPLTLWLLWHVLTAAALALVGSDVRFGAPPWAVPGPDRMFLFGLAAAYLLAGIISLWRAARREGVRFGELILIVAGTFGAASFAFLVLDSPTSRVLLLGATGAALVGTMVPFVRLPRPAGVLLVLMSAGAVAALTIRSAPTVADAPVRRQVFTTPFYGVELRIHDRLIRSQSRGGAVDVVGDTLLIAAGDGRLYAADLSAAALSVRALPYRIPINLDEFTRATETRVSKQDFRVADILAIVDGTDVDLLASHHYWDNARRCFTVRISRLTAPRAELLAGTAKAAWRTLYDTRPCLALKSDPAQAPFSGDETGGRLLAADGNAVLLTVGDFAHDGWNSADLIAQDDANDYGKIVRVSLADGSGAIYTSGHRNAQGLARAADGRVWSTEHGPYGGDELNVIEQGANYGWPRVTLGVDYGQHKWPLNAEQGQHAGYAAPVHAWLPSMGISSLIALRGDAFALWKDDLLAGTLNGGTLFRMRVDGDRVIYAEPIRIGERIRDLVEAPDGRIVMLFDSGGIGMLRPVADGRDGESSTYFTSEMRGELLFSTCTVCHGPAGTAPPLGGILGRRVASIPGYQYSEALLKLGGIWTDKRLDEFLADPERYAPGTTMRLGSVADASDRQSLIAHLKTLR